MKISLLSVYNIFVGFFLEWRSYIKKITIRTAFLRISSFQIAVNVKQMKNWDAYPIMWQGEKNMQP